jgi:glycosyltransferase involved in cell wall biosynthesis
MFDRQRHGGISRYFVNLISRISGREDVTAKVSVLFTDNYYLRSTDGWVKNPIIGKLLFGKKTRMSKWNKIYSRYCILRNNFDVFHPTYFHPYFLGVLKKPFVLTVHDMIYELYPSYFNQNDLTSEYKLKLIEKACHIIAISETTKNDLIRLTKVPGEKITVVHHGHTPIKNSKVPAVVIPAEYLLFVGDRNNYKNFSVFASAASEVMKQYLGLKLVCVGGGGLTNDEKSLLVTLGISDRLIHYDASDDLLYWLYKNAIAFVYPSLYEGFGLPILEAFEADCPVILSNTPSFLEVAAEAALFFDPSDYKSLADCLRRVLQDLKLREDLISLGQQRLKMFTMEKCINETIDVYKNCLND